MDVPETRLAGRTCPAWMLHYNRQGTAYPTIVPSPQHLWASHTRLPQSQLALINEASTKGNVCAYATAFSTGNQSA